MYFICRLCSIRLDGQPISSAWFAASPSQPEVEHVVHQQHRRVPRPDVVDRDPRRERVLPIYRPLGKRRPTTRALLRQRRAERLIAHALLPPMHVRAANALLPRQLFFRRRRRGGSCGIVRL